MVTRKITASTRRRISVSLKKVYATGRRVDGGRALYAKAHGINHGMTESGLYSGPDRNGGAVGSSKAVEAKQSKQLGPGMSRQDIRRMKSRHLKKPTRAIMLKVRRAMRDK